MIWAQNIMSYVELAILITGTRRCNQLLVIHRGYFVIIVKARLDYWKSILDQRNMEIVSDLKIIKSVILDHFVQNIVLNNLIIVS